MTIDETVEGGAPERIRELTMDEPDVRIRRATRWRCDRRTRTFVVSAADGRSATASVRGHALVRAPARARGAAARARGRSGARTACSIAGGSEGCARGSASSPPAVRRAGERRRAGARGLRGRFAALRPGGWLLRAAIEGGSAHVGECSVGGRLTVLATGDSMIQIIDSYLKQRLRARGVRVRSDAHISTGISKPGLLDWQALGPPPGRARQAGRGRRCSSGANDGFPMGGRGLLRQRRGSPSTRAARAG